ncbi:YceK/YidQ family lipoprotein [Pseudomonas sp. Z8(2022)]|uniref:YceK/YidQ family lipoprotein n=1 Tax=Pseudomonas sp. Z8(2022) TaxID=2962597 RepID=UPI0021F49601|nr:YceK/YidQ family lipoprotein [Pseudomonas sp. Z8(2022)]UYP29331.1 YceK/YidQ family lipoprotein [Pseudomonas sp. Z8(2022)]
MLKPIYRIFALSVLVSAVAGCGTLFGRNGSYYGPDYYSGTAYDFGVLFGSDEVNRGYFPATAWCWLSVVCPVLTVFSLPVDAAVDTVMLPHDIHQANKPIQ